MRIQVKIVVLAGIFAAICLLATSPGRATEAGMRRLTVLDEAGAAPPIAVALYYPTRAPARAITMGAFTARVAMNAPPDATMKALIVVSHGTGGSEVGHTSLAEALARGGYLVAALRHPGDNWQDRSLLRLPHGGYFVERPRQASRVIDAVLSHPDWKDRIAADARGPRVGAIGHSAGGYTVLALAGGEPAFSQLLRHCDAERVEDPIFCSVGDSTAASAAGAPLDAAPSPRDPRVRAVVSLAPVGVVLTAASLAAIEVPTLVYHAGADRFLVPRFHGEWIRRHAVRAEIRPVTGAGHFAFMDKPGMAVPTEDGDAGDDPPGFDRPALLRELQEALPAFFDREFR